MLISHSTVQTVTRKRKRTENNLGHYGLGTDAPWYQPQELSKSERSAFSEMAKRSANAKRRAEQGDFEPKHEINIPKLDPQSLMPQLPRNGLRSLSLFSGGGGLDLGFDRAGFEHGASYEIVTDAAATLSANRPHWKVESGEGGGCHAGGLAQDEGGYYPRWASLSALQFRRTPTGAKGRTEPIP